MANSYQLRDSFQSRVYRAEATRALQVGDRRGPRRRHAGTRRGRVTQQNWKVTLRLRPDKTIVRNFYADTEEDAVRAAIWNWLGRALHVQPTEIIEGFYAFTAGGKECHASVERTNDEYAVNYKRK